MEVQDIIRKALEREKEMCGGLRITKPNISLAKARKKRNREYLPVIEKPN